MCDFFQINNEYRSEMHFKKIKYFPHPRQLVDIDKPCFFTARLTDLGQLSRTSFKLPRPTKPLDLANWNDQSPYLQ